MGNGVPCLSSLFISIKSKRNKETVGKPPVYGQVLKDHKEGSFFQPRLVLNFKMSMGLFVYSNFIFPLVFFFFFLDT